MTKGIGIHYVRDKKEIRKESRFCVPENVAQSLMIDDQPIPVSHLRTANATLVNGWVNAYYKLTPDLVGKIRSAKTVGIAFQGTYAAPTFMGFDGMEIADGREKLTGFISACH